VIRKLENLTEMLKGVLEGCVLEIISRGETYGYEITRQLNALGFTDVVDGTTYTILVRAVLSRTIFLLGNCLQNIHSLFTNVNKEGGCIISLTVGVANSIVV
jgi:hypothetical protein